MIRRPLAARAALAALAACLLLTTMSSLPVVSCAAQQMMNQVELEMAPKLSSQVSPVAAQVASPARPAAVAAAAAAAAPALALSVAGAPQPQSAASNASGTLSSIGITGSGSVPAAPTTNHLNASSAARPGTVRQLAQAAPYAIESKQSGSGAKDNNAQPFTKNILFRLNPNKHSTTYETLGEEPWTLISQNGSWANTRVNFDLKRLLDTLDSNNFTSEVKFDDHDGVVNITISNYRGPNETGPIFSDSQSSGPGRGFGGAGPHAVPIDELLLEELLVDVKWQSGLNGNSVLKDNHRYEASSSRQHPIRAKPIAIEAAITAPPIRGAIEVVAENYTVRKIADEANVFALKLLHQLNIEKLGSRNLVQAPFGVYQGLALLLTGAMGETAKELDKVLLGSQSSYENTKLTHDQDRSRLLASLGDVMKQLQFSATHHSRTPYSNDSQLQQLLLNSLDNQRANLYQGGTPEQHLIMANNLLFSPGAYEISNEFKSALNGYYNNTALTKIEIGSTESIQVVNAWIRRITAGVIPAVFNKKSTFDEFNVMALLCTSWLTQEWRDTFYKVPSALRSNIRLKGTAAAAAAAAAGPSSPSSQVLRRARRSLNGASYLASAASSNSPANRFLLRDSESLPASLLEFVDDNKQSHFVDYIISKPSKNIHHYHSILSGVVVDLVAVPFKDSNHRLITLTPVSLSNPANGTQQFVLDPAQMMGAAASILSASQNNNNNNNINNGTVNDPPDSSLLSRLIASFASNPRKAMRSIWNIIAPDLITKQTLHNIQLARQKNVTIDAVETSIIPLVQLSMPIIRSEADSSVSAALNHIGIVNSFDPDQANFIGINGHPFNYYKLHLSNVVSKTTFNLNERGINYDKTIKTLEALRIFPSRQKQQNEQENIKVSSSSSSSGTSLDSTFSTDDSYIKLELVDEVKLNRPFMYLICDIKTKLILYTGVVRNPMQEGP